MVGGSQRLRISSQSLKRAWRTSALFQEALKGKLGIRTKDLGNLVYEKLTKEKVDPERADEIAQRVAGEFGKLKGKKGNDGRQIEQLAHLSAAEVQAVEELIKKAAKGDKLTDEDFDKLVGDGLGTVDIAMFGRMLAAKPKYNVDAAVQVAHAVTVNKVSVEDDFFTAVDDLNKGDEDRGAGHMGTTEFGSGVFYHYVCINRTQLLKNLNGDEESANKAIDALCRACVQISPTGKQNSFASRARASYLLAERGTQQPRSLAVAFLEAVKGDNILSEAIQRLKDTREKMNDVYGPCCDAERSFNAVTGEGDLNGVCGFITQEGATT